MPVWPKSLYTLGVNFQTARAAARLRRKADPVAQPRAFDALTRALGAMTFWQQAGIEAGMNYEAFRTRVAPCGYGQLAPAIDRMKRGEPDVLWRGHCSFFALSAGTTGSTRKYIPVTDDLLYHFRDAGFDAMLYYTARIGRASVFRGRHLFLGGSTALAPIAESAPHHAYAGNLGGIAALNLPPWAEKHLYEPGAGIAQMADWSAKIDAIVARTSPLDISLIAGMPTWVLLLAAAMREKNSGGKVPLAHLQGLWRNLACFVHGGVPIGPFQAELRATLGPTVRFHEVYPAAEGFIAAQDADAAAGLRLMTNWGIFFEFVPMADYDEARLEQLGPKAVPLAGVKAGVDYALLLTTPGGFARYALGDVVRFTSVEPPRLIHVGRTKLQLNAFGERVAERELTEALTAVCTKHNWSIVNFHVSPLFTSNFTGTIRGKHEWWIELRPGTVATPIGPPMAAALDVELLRLSEGYAAKRRSGGIDPPTVRLVMPGVFAHWLKHHGKWGGENKTPRARSDRLIADELAQITSFPRD